MVKKCLREVPGHLETINRYCGGNIKKTGFAANSHLSIADVVLLAWISQVLANPTRLREMEPLLAAQPTLEYYWNYHKDKLDRHLENRPLALF